MANPVLDNQFSAIYADNDAAVSSVFVPTAISAVHGAAAPSFIKLEDRLLAAKQQAALIAENENEDPDRYHDEALDDPDLFARTVETTQGLKNDQEDYSFFFNDFAGKAARVTQRAADGLAGFAEHIGLGRSAADTIRSAGRALAGRISGDYLTNLGRVESGNRDNARASTSSAAGRFQFIEQTWLGTVAQYGTQYRGALAEAAQKIYRGKDGRYHVEGGYAAEQSVLNMRYNLEYSRPMANAYAATNAAILEAKLGRSVNATELYIGGHFLNANTDGRRFLQALNDNPDAPAANYVSHSVLAANACVFGHGHTVKDVYNRFARQFGESPVQLAQAPSPTTRSTGHVVDARLG